MTSNINAEMLVLGLKAKFCGLGFAIGWPWDCGLRGLALAKNSRPKSWQTTMFTMNFHRLEWIIFQHPHSLLTVATHGRSWWYGTSFIPNRDGLGLECSGLVNITASMFYGSGTAVHTASQSHHMCSVGKQAAGGCHCICSSEQQADIKNFNN